MHIADGVLPLPVLLSGAVCAAGLTAWTLRELLEEDVPKAAVVASALFAASHLSIRLGGTSVHLILCGLAGVLLGRAAFPTVLVGVGLQTALFQHGGLTALGVNATTMGSGALAAAWIFQWSGRRDAAVRQASVPPPAPGGALPVAPALEQGARGGPVWGRSGAAPCSGADAPARVGRRAALAAGLGTLVALALYAGALGAAGESLRLLATGALLAHLPIVVVEALVAGAAARFLARVEPRLLTTGARRGATLAVLALVWSLGPGAATAYAHRVDLDVWAQGARVGGEALFSDGAPVRGARVEVRAQEGAIVARGETDAAGRFSIEVPAAHRVTPAGQPAELTVVVADGAGHRDEARVRLALAPADRAEHSPPRRPPGGEAPGEAADFRGMPSVIRRLAIGLGVIGALALLLKGLQRRRQRPPT